MKHDVKSWMTHELVKIDVSEDVKTAEKIMREEAISHLLVTDEGRVTGILSTRDLSLAETIRNRFPEEEAKTVKITVGDLMNRHPQCIGEDKPVKDAIKIMDSKNYHSLPVCNVKGDITGIFTATDVMKYAIVASEALA